MLERTALNPKLKYPWQQPVLDAVMEFEPERLSEKITAAEKGISARVAQRPTDPGEERALRDASFALGILQHVILESQGVTSYACIRVQVAGGETGMCKDPSKTSL